MIIVQSDVFMVIALTLGIIGIAYYAGNKIRAADILAKPKGVVHIATMVVSTVDNMVLENTNKTIVKKLGPYIGTIGSYILISNLLGLFALKGPTSNLSCTLALALITLVLRERQAIKTNGLKGYLHGFIEPIVPFIIPNFFGKIAPLISMSLRLFGNIMSGTVIMTLVYAFTGWLSSLVPFIGDFNFIGPVLAPVLHAYFDVFSGCIQTFIFITLTMVYVGIELPSEN